MATSTLQLLPTLSTTDISQPDHSSSSSTMGVSYDLKRLKVYSSCLRCRAKKVKCDRKEPCSRCEKHQVECSYQELATVQLDIRQFQKHLNNPKTRKDGNLITPTPSSVISTSSSTSTSNTLTSTSSSNATATTGNPPVSPAHSSNSSNASTNGDNNSKNHHTTSSSSSLSSSQSASSSTQNSYDCPLIGNSKAPVRVVTQKFVATDPGRMYRVHRRKPSSKASKGDHPDGRAERDRIRKDVRDISEHVDRVRLSDSNISATSTAAPKVAIAGSSRSTVDTPMSPSGPEDKENHASSVPIWRAQAVGKHKQTAHEQDLAETFGLAAYLQAKEIEISQDSGRAKQPTKIDYEMELEHALDRRLPSSGARPDRTYNSRPRKYTHNGYNPSTPYARPPHCQLAPYPSHHHANCHGNGSDCGSNGKARTNGHTQPPSAAQCCCQIAAMQGQTLGSCPYSNVSYSYDRPSLPPLSSSTSASSRSTAQDHHEEPPRIAYSPSYSPSYSPRYCPPEAVISYGGSSGGHRSYSPPLAKPLGWSPSPSSPSSPGYSSSSILPPLRLPSSPSHSALPMKMDVITSPSTELPPLRWSGPSSPPPFSSPTSSSFPMASPSTELEVGRDEDVPVQQVECKYNEPNVDVWDMIEKPVKRGRSIKMEMNWILSQEN
ncbi:MAG: hypothetical protein J3Q66DRAFT_131388 [Benniella sp.]|nr:MAG: hypothetical protein J3Q66DRAFT_131388 [Benniella sp.]